MSYPRKLSLAFATLLTLSGCGGQLPEWTRERAAAVTTRTYSSRTPEQVLQATEKALRASDPRKFSFDYGEDGFVAKRRMGSYFLIGAVYGTFDFRIKVRASGQGTVLEVKIYDNLNSVTASGGAPASGTLIELPDPYSMVFNRTERALGLRDDWQACDAEGVSKNRTLAICGGAREAPL